MGAVHGPRPLDAQGAEWEPEAEDTARAPAPPAADSARAAPASRAGPNGGRLAVVAALAEAAAAAPLSGGELAAPVGRPGALELVPGRCADAVSLSSVLAAMPPEQAEGALGRLGALLERTTGVRPSAEQLAEAASGAGLARLVALSPAQLSAGMDALNAAYRAGALGELPPRPQRLPDGFDLAELPSLSFELPQPELEPLAPGLWHGDAPGALPPARARANIAAAEIFDRLAANAGLPEGERFSVRYAGGTYTRLDTLLDRLLADGHTIEVEVRHRVANFANLKTRAPDGRLLDVPLPLLVRTGVRGPDGEEAAVPAVHSELVLHIRPGPETAGPGLTADVKWYQGVNGTGFFPCDLTASPAWCGGVVTERWTGERAREAAALAGLLGEAIRASARAQGLAAGGYGITGVCNDSVAIVQHALSGRVTGHPLLMRDEALQGELERRLAEGPRRDGRRYRRLLASIAAVPSDQEPNGSAPARALASLPWPPGREPLGVAIHARAALEGAG
ncbi:MAG: hypothetical protein KatS3mg102_0385 [Planctomycetota bacterium]|nr:MAG: hypothetical protein KatS3mg102_0385 [Planctomycetota bacterium]